MPSKAANERLFLVDAYSLIFQVFHALPPMSGPGGLPTNALFGFTKDLLYLRNELKPDYLLICWDVAGPTFRDQLYKEYKAHRAPMPDDLQLQVPLIQQMLEAMRIPQLGVSGFEADDLMATVGRAAAARGIDVSLCTSDKDCRQLLDDRIRIYNLRKRQEFTRESLLEDWGVTPEQVVDLQTLVGDSVDNVPGVKGVGVKTAAKLLQEHGSLDNLMAHLDKVKGKLKENLQAAEPILPRSRQLVRLDTAVPLEMDWDGWRRKEWDAPRLLELFQKWGFRTFAEQVRSQGSGVRGQGSGIRSQGSGVRDQGSGDTSPKRERGMDQESEGGNQEAGGGTQGELFSEGELFPFGANAPGSDDNRPLSAVGSDGWKADYQLVDTPKRFEGFLKKLSKQRRFAVDLETTGLERMTSDIVGLAFSWKEGEAYYLAVRGPAGTAVLDPEETLQRLRPVLEDAGVAKVNQNIKFDLLVLRRHGVQVQGVAGDPMVADYLLRPGERGHNLEELARRHLHHQVIPITELIGKKGKNKPQLRMDEVATSRVAAYAGEDADVARRLCGLLEGELVAAGLAKLYESVEVPLIEVLAELEYNGIRLDVPLLREMSRQMAGQLAATEKEIYELAGRPFNIASLPQLRQVLFDELKLPVQRKTGITGAASTDQETLEKLAAVHPLPRKILEHRQIAKLKSTYVDALPELVNPHTGRVHASFNQTVAATGRLSASDPNLQNIPIRTELGGQIRQAFVPEEGWVLLTADYSQIELRMLAHFSGDEELRRAFAEDRDIHAAVAAQIFGVPEAEVTREQRRVAKTVNFGVIYGMSAHGLAQRLEIPREEAGKFIDAYFGRYPKVLDYQANLLKNCLAVGYVSTILGRRRQFDPSGIRANSTYQQRNQPEREAINMEIQGSAADLMKLAMLNVYRRLKREGRRARLLLQIHDELVLEAPPEELAEVARLVHEEMTTPLEKELRLEVPLKVDLAAGPNWLDVEELKTTTDAHK